MNFETKSLDLSSAALEKADVLIVLVGEGFKSKNDGLAALITGAIKDADLSLKAGKSLHVYRPPQCAARRLVLLGIGDGSAAHVQQAIASVVGALKPAPVKRMVIVHANPSHQDWPEAAVRAVSDASYVYSYTKSKTEASSLQRVVLGIEPMAMHQFDLARARAVALGVEFAKQWANRPGNHATPTLLGQGAQSLGSFTNISCTVLGPRDIEKLKMGAFASVAQGSEEPARFIVLRYDGAGKAVAPTVLVGKGITFDTGGISIKPAGEMDEMKFDMCGAASVLGTFRALAELQPKINVIGLIPSCENMPDGRALKPGDVVTSMSGQTIEVLNTDAEGRLVLCDALTYAERFNPTAVVDIATLTGACVIALGGVRSGLFSNNAALSAELVAAGESARDLCWPMPLDDGYAESLKTNFADVANIGGRAGGAITAAKFLQRFADKFPWAHLDIAGVAWTGGKGKGATGRPVGLLVDFLMARVAADVGVNPRVTSAVKPRTKRSAAPSV